MNNDSIKIAIAESTGWEWMRVDESPWFSWFLNGERKTIALEEYQKNVSLGKLPDFCGDLNVMAQTCQTVSETGHYKFLGHLYSIMRGEVTDHGDNKFSAFNVAIMVHATARQRAEAYLKTIGKWNHTKSKPNKTK